MDGRFWNLHRMGEAPVSDRSTTASKDSKTESNEKAGKALIHDVNEALKKDNSNGADTNATKATTELEQRQVLPKLVLAEFGSKTDNGNEINVNQLRDRANPGSGADAAERLAALFVVNHANDIDKDHSGMISKAELEEWAKNNKGELDNVRANSDGSVVLPGPNGKPTEVIYANGRSATFDYDKQSGQLNAIKTSDGDTLTRVGDQWVSSRSQSLVTDVKANDDGTFSYKRDGVKYQHDTNDIVEKKDDKDRTTEIIAPDGKKTTVQYANATDTTPSGYTLPDGATIKRNGDQWVDAQGKPISNVTADGANVRFDRDNMHVLHKQDGSEVTSDQQNRVTAIKYKDGSQYTFDWSNGTNWDVQPDGTYRVATNDGSNTVRKTDNSYVTQRDGHVTDIRYPDGKTTHFDYDPNGHVIRVADKSADGKQTTTYEAENGDPNGRFLVNGKDSGLRMPIVSDDGTFGFARTADGIRNFRTTDGSEYQNRTDGAQAGSAALNDSALQQAARSIHDGLNSTTLWVFDSPEAQKVLNTLEPMSAQDRANLEDYYRKQYGTELRLDLAKHLNKEQYAQIEGVLNRKDGGADDLTQVELAMQRLQNVSRTQEVANNPLIFAGGDGNGAFSQAYLQGRLAGDRQQAEKDLRDTLAILNPSQYAELEKQYQAKHPGHTLAGDLQNDKDISEPTRKALDIYTHKTGALLTDQQIRDLSEIGLQSKNADIFNEAWRNASPELRKSFSTPENLKRIDDAFGDRAQISKDYLQSGHINLSTLVRGDTHWWHTDKEQISSALAGASEEDRQKYIRGYQLANNIGDTGAKPGDDEARKFYNDLHGALDGAKGSDRELALWEAQLMQKGGLIANLAAQHDDGFGIPLTGWHVGGGHDFDNVVKTVENMTEADWKKLNDPLYKAELDKTLKTFLSGSEYDKIHKLIEEKSKASSFEQSRKIDSRVVFQGADPDLPDLRGNGHAIDSLLGMTQQDRDRYQKDENYRKKFDTEISKLEGNEKILAERLMQQLRNGEQPHMGPIENVIKDTTLRVTDDGQIIKPNAHDTILDIEAAFKADPTLRERLNHPAPGSEDEKLRKLFDDALKFSIDSSIAPGFAADRYTLYHYQLFEQGHVELGLKMQLTLDSKDGREQRLQMYKDILSASPEERALLLGNDKKSKDFQDQIFRFHGDFSDAEKQFLRKGLEQGGQLRPEDLIRMQVVSGGKFEDYAKIFSGDDWNKMSDRERAALADTYKQKYGGDFKEDILQKLDGNAKTIMSNVIDQGGFRTEDIVRAYVTGTGKFTEEDVRKALSSPYFTNPQKEQFKNEYARKYGSDANNDILSKIPGEKRIEYLHYLTPATRNPRQDAYDERAEYEKHRSDIGDWLLSRGWNYSKEQAGGALDNIYSFVQKHADEINNLPPEKQEEFKKLITNYDEAQKRYIESKGQFAEEFVNTTMMLAAAGGAFFTGGTSWEFYATIAASGAAFKAGTKAAIEGTDYKADPFSITRDLVTGGSLAAVSFMGPEIFGQMLGIGEKAAGTTAARIFESRATAALIKSDLTEEALKTELSAITRNAFIAGGKDVDQGVNDAIKQLAAKYGQPGKEAELAEIIQKTLNEQMADGSKNFLLNAVREYGTIAAAGGAGGAVTGFEDAAFDGHPEQWVSRTLGGFLDGSISALALAPVFKGAVKIVEHGSGLLSGKRVAEVEMGGRKYQSADGVNWSTPEGDRFSGVLTRGENGEVKFKTNRGEITRGADGSFVEKEAGTTRHYDSSGRVTEVNAADGKKWSYEYDPSGKPTKIQVTENGQVVESHATTDGTNWEHTINGYTSRDTRPVKVARDGTIEQQLDLRTSLIEGPDGLKVKKDILSGKEEVFSSTPEQVRDLRSSFESQLTPIKNAEHLDRINKWMDALELRMKNGDFTQDQLATVYREMNKLLSTENGMIPREARMVVAEQMLADMAKWDVADQGQHNTCALTSAQKMMGAHDPATYAHNMTEAILTGKVTLTNGTVLDLSDPSMGIFTPDREAQFSLNRPFDFASGNYPADIRKNGDRNFAGQIYQSIVANVDLATKSEIFLPPPAGGHLTGLKPGDIRYTVDHTATPPQKPERLMDYRTNPPTPVRDSAGNLVDSPNINGYSNFPEIMRQLGYDGVPIHSIGGPRVSDTTGTVTRATDAANLRATLEAWQNAHELPVFAVVDAKNPVFAGQFGTGLVSTTDNHMIVIKSIDAQGVHISNSWGSGADIVIPVDEFFRGLTN